MTGAGDRAVAGEPRILEPVEGLRMELPAEPTDLKANLRMSELRGEAEGDGGYPLSFGMWLWQIWRPALEPAGTSRELFLDVVDAYRRELWLWLMGERLWEQMLSGLAGRIARKLQRNPEVAASARS